MVKFGPRFSPFFGFGPLWVLTGWLSPPLPLHPGPASSNTAEDEDEEGRESEEEQLEEGVEGENRAECEEEDREEKEENRMRDEAEEGEPTRQAMAKGVEGEKIKAERECRDVKRITDPRRPSEDMVLRHKAQSHIPCRNWCPICIMAQGRDTDNRAEVGK